MLRNTLCDGARDPTWWYGYRVPRPRSPQSRCSAGGHVTLCTYRWHLQVSCFFKTTRSRRRLRNKKPPQLYPIKVGRRIGQRYIRRRIWNHERFITSELENEDKCTHLKSESHQFNSNQIFSSIDLILGWLDSQLMGMVIRSGNCTHSWSIKPA